MRCEHLHFLIVMILLKCYIYFLVIHKKFTVKVRNIPCSNLLKHPLDHKKWLTLYEEVKFLQDVEGYSALFRNGVPFFSLIILCEVVLDEAVVQEVPQSPIYGVRGRKLCKVPVATNTFLGEEFQNFLSSSGTQAF